MRAGVLLVIVALLLAAVAAAEDKDERVVRLLEEGGKLSYYEVLGAEPGVPARKLKRAYRSAALAFHPDKFTDPEKKGKAEVLFVRITKAFKVLSDPMKRRQYDDLLEAGVVDYDKELWALVRSAMDDGRSVEETVRHYQSGHATAGPSMSDIDLARGMFEDEDWGNLDDEGVDKVLRLGLLSFFAVCVLPIVYGVYANQKGSPGQAIKKLKTKKKK